MFTLANRICCLLRCGYCCGPIGCITRIIYLILFVFFAVYFVDCMDLCTAETKFKSANFIATGIGTVVLLP